MWYFVVTALVNLYRDRIQMSCSRVYTMLYIPSKYQLHKFYVRKEIWIFRGADQREQTVELVIGSPSVLNED